ncbi:unnamed protein product [Rhizophagus irregularis]|nr:unnamed protein product [Rhizophagus irregularis]
MKRCWDPSPDNRPSAIEIEKLIESFYNNFSEIVYVDDIEDCNNNEEIKRQFEEAEEYRKTNLLSVKNNQLSMHPQAYYTSRLLNSFTKYLTECLECSIND